MQQLTIEHKSNNQKQKIVSKSEESVENKREGKGRSLAISRNVCRLQNTDTYYVQSESAENIYYYVRYNFGVLEWCSCPDNSIRSIKCKHQFAIEYAIRLGTLKDIEHLPKEAKRYPVSEVVQQSKPRSWKDDEYSF
jgi:predicted nucleic acid-binding Zn finger protein